MKNGQSIQNVVRAYRKGCARIAPIRSRIGNNLPVRNDATAVRGLYA